MLNNNAFQLNIIDSYAGTGQLIEKYRSEFTIYRKLQKEFDELNQKHEKNRNDLEYFRAQLSQLDEAKLKPGEQDELEKEQELLGHAEDIKLALAGASRLLSDESGSVLSLLREVRSVIARINTFLPSDLNIHSRLDSSFIELDDISNEIARIEQETEADPRRLELVNGRLDMLYTLFRKHHTKDLGELISRKTEIENSLKSIETGDERLNELAGLLAAATETLRASAGKISEMRKASLPAIESKISSQLKQLGIPNARFEISLTATADFTSSGTDTADFLFSANRQTRPEDLARIASGGELSRVMLSLKSLLTRSKNLPTIIWDEIDSGVSGEVADKVGQILLGMGKYMQVVNITHLPQVASRGNVHYHVYKEDTGDSTITRVKLLSAEERVREVARLLSGSEVTEISISNARELIRAGSK